MTFCNCSCSLSHIVCFMANGISQAIHLLICLGRAAFLSVTFFVNDAERVRGDADYTSPGHKITTTSIETLVLSKFTSLGYAGSVFLLFFSLNRFVMRTGEEKKKKLAQSCSRSSHMNLSLWNLPSIRATFNQHPQRKQHLCFLLFTGSDQTKTLVTT